jgi:hypothetical protein
VIRNSLLQKKRLQDLITKCSNSQLIYVFIEGELGLWQNIVDNVSQLLDNATCPTRLAVHILEPVSSIREEDMLLKELERACKNSPNFNTFFKESVFVHKIHRLKLDETNAVSHILSSLQRTLTDDDFIVWIPSHARLKKNWDADVRKEIGKGIIVWPFPEAPKLDIERYFYSEPVPEPSFFRLSTDFQYEPFPMARPGSTKSLGVSLRHGVGCKRSELIKMSDCKTDLCATYEVFGHDIINGSSALGFSVRPSVNRLANIESIPQDVKFQYAQGIKDETVYGRAILGMTLDFSMQEILVKWGSEVALEREKDALLYG